MTFDPDFPGAIVVEAAQYGYGASPNHPKAWCLHTPEEKPDDYPGTPYYFHNLTDRRASTTYFVSYLGFVFQCVPEIAGAYANAREGVPGHFDWEDPYANLNLQTLSVEIEGYAASIDETMPRGSPQWVALVRLMAHRCQALGIPPERTFGHKQVSIYRSDPGALDIAALVGDVRALLDGVKEDDMKSVIVQVSGDFYFVGPGYRTYIGKSAGFLGTLYPVKNIGDAGAPATTDELFAIPDLEGMPWREIAERIDKTT